VCSIRTQLRHYVRRRDGSGLIEAMAQSGSKQKAGDDVLVLSKRTVYLVGAILAGVALALALFQMVRSSTSGLEQIEGPKIATIGASVTGQLADGYPSAVPKWEGATVVSSDHAQRLDFDVYDLTLSTSDPLDEVINGYLTGLRKAGFNAKAHDINPIMTSVEASTTQHSATFVFFTDETGQTGITASIRTVR